MRYHLLRYLLRCVALCGLASIAWGQTPGGPAVAASSLREMRAAGAGVTLTDHTPLPPADPQTLPEPLRGLYLPQKALEGVKPVLATAEGPVRSISLGWLGGERYLWQVQLATPLAGQQSLTLHIDTDNNTATGRREEPAGAELVVTAALEQVAAKAYMSDGVSLTARRVHGAVSGTTVAFTTDWALASRVAVTAALGRTRCPRVVLQDVEGAPAAVRLEPTRGGGAGESRRRSEDGLEVVETLQRQNGYLGWKVTVRNTGRERRWLDLQLTVPAMPQGEWRWFDCFNLTPHSATDNPLFYSGTSAVYPLTALWGREGLALGLNPWSVYSELHAGVTPGEKSQALSLGERIVVDAGAAETLEFVIFGFAGEEGWRGAMSRYWALFPEAFERAAEIDPGFHRAAAGGLHWSFADPADAKWAPDLIRRLQGGWEWGYAPVARPGEWAMGELSVGEWYRSRGTVKKSLRTEDLPAMQEQLRRRLDSGIADTAVAFYMHLKSVEEGLVRRHFADSLMDSYAPVEYLGYYQLVPCLQLYPWGNRYGQYLQEAIPTVAKRYTPAGIGFDSVFGLLPHHGGGMLQSPGRSFANGRLFVAEGVGFARQMDVVRAQEVGGQRLGMVANLKLPTLMGDAVRTDSALLEFHPVNNPGYLERVQRLRLMAGRKMMSWWHTYEPEHFRWIAWDKLTPEQTLDAFRRLRDDLLIHSLYYGCTPNARFSSGVPKLVRALPMLVEVSAQGWEPLIAARGAGGRGLLLSRFGSGPGMCYGVGNQDYTTLCDDLVIEQRLTGGQDLVFADTEAGVPVQSSYASGQATLQQISVPARNVRALRAVAAAPLGALQQAQAVWEAAAGQTGELRLRVTVAKAGQVALSVWLPERSHRPQVLLEGKPVAGRQVGNLVQARPALAAGANALVVRWEPETRLQGSLEALLNYPFVTAGKPAAEIVAPAELQSQALRIQEYFREWYLHAAPERTEVRLAIVRPQEAQGERQIVLSVTQPTGAAEGPLTGSYGVETNKLVIAAASPEVLDRAVKQMLGQLDARYVWWGPLGIKTYYHRDPGATEAPEVVRAGLAGKLLEGEDTGSMPDRDKLPRLPVFE